MSESQEEQEDVEVLTAFDTGERIRETPAVIVHERGIPLALRVRSGFLDESGLNLEGAQVPWADIEYISMGVIHHSLGSMEPPKGMMRQVVGKIMGKNDRAESKGPRYQESTFLDLYSCNHDAPFRFEAANINYRSFLGRDAAYISQHNFYKLVVRICRQCSEARINENTYNFLTRRRDQVKSYPAIYDYELESQTELGRLEFLRKTADMDLTRENYTLEESEELGTSSDTPKEGEFTTFERPEE